MVKKIFFLLLFFTITVATLEAQVIQSSGTGGAYTISNYPGNFTGYYDGFAVMFRANHNNPGAVTLNINAAGTKSVVNTANSVLAINDIKADQAVTLVFSATNNHFQMVSTSGNISAGSSISGGGTSGQLARFTGTNSLGNSIIVDDGTNVGVGVTPGGSYKFEVNGLVGSTGINETSDQRYKKNIFTIEMALQKVMALRGVNYDWRTEKFKEKNFVSTPQIGLIAQEVEKIIPQIVATDAKGFKSVEYSKLVALLIEAIKEQQLKIDALSTENTSLKNNAASVTAEINALKADVKNLHDAAGILLNENVSLKSEQK